LQACPALDSAVRGEGEETVVELATRLRGDMPLDGCQGVTFRRGAQIIDNVDRPLIANLDTLPFPQRGEAAKHLKFLRISSIRGCMGRCSFCDGADGTRQPGPRVRTRLIASLLDEMEELIARYHTNCFEIMDSSFEDPLTPGHQRIRELVESIAQRQLDVRYVLQFRTETFVEHDAALLRQLQQSGMEAVFLGLEAGNVEDLRLFRKRATLQDHRRSLRLFRELDIHVLLGFINFTPYSTVERLRANVDFLHQEGLAYNLEAFCSRLEIYLGTPILASLRRDGLTTCCPPFVEPYDYAFVHPGIGELCRTLQMLDTPPITDFGFREKALICFMQSVRRIAWQCREIEEQYRTLRAAHTSFKVAMNDLAAQTMHACLTSLEKGEPAVTCIPRLEHLVQAFKRHWADVIHQQYCLGMAAKRKGVALEV
jgi:hypothetical protein